MGGGGSKIKKFFEKDVGGGLKKAANAVKDGFEKAADETKDFFEDDVGGGIKDAANKTKDFFEDDVKDFITDDVKNFAQDAHKEVVKGVNKVGKVVDEVPYVGKAITGTVSGIHSGLDNVVSGAVKGDWERVGEGAIGAVTSATGRSFAKQSNRLIDDIPGARTALGFVRIPGLNVSAGSLATAANDMYRLTDDIKDDVADGGKFDYKRHLVNTGTGALRFGLSNITPGAVANMGVKGGNMIAGQGSKGIAGTINNAILGGPGSQSREQIMQMANSEGGKKMRGVVTGLVRNKAKNTIDGMLQYRPGKRPASTRAQTSIAPGGSYYEQVKKPRVVENEMSQPERQATGQPMQGQDDERMQSTLPPRGMEQLTQQAPRQQNIRNIMDPRMSTLLPTPFQEPPAFKSLGRVANSGRLSGMRPPDFPGLMTQEIVGRWMGNPAM